MFVTSVDSIAEVHGVYDVAQGTKFLKIPIEEV